MDIGTTLVAGRQPPKVVEPGERALDDPSVSAEPLARLDAATCDTRDDSAYMASGAAEDVIVGFVGVPSGGLARGGGSKGRPAPERHRKRTWARLLRGHWATLYACDFFSVEVLGVFGTVRYVVFFVMCIRTRAVQIAGVRIAPDGEWMKQIARNLLDPVDGFLRHATHLIHDRDPVFTEAWTVLLKTGGVTCVPIPARSPNCNPHAERFVKTMRSECLDHFVIFGERHLRHLVGEFADHYHTERYHQGLGSQIIMPTPSPSNDNASPGAIGCRSRLGGLLNFYRREAA
jgi:putative transposase